MTQDPERYAYNNLRWNLIVRTADLGLWHGGQSLASIVTVIPAFAARLGASNTVIGLIPAIQMTCMSLPGIFFANYIEQSGRLLPFLMRYTALERLPLLIVAIAAYFLAQSNPKLTLALTLMALTVMYVAGGAMLPAWMGLMAKIFPVNVRGRFFALVGFLGAAMGLGASGAIGYVLDTFPYPLGYVVCLAFASIVMGAGVIILAYVREAHVVPERPRVDLGDYLSRLPSILRVNRNFTWYLAARSVASFGAMSTGFFTVYALGELDMAEWQIGAFTFAMLAAQVVVFPVVGYLADRFGHKLVITAGTAFLVLANVEAVLAAEQGWLIYLVFVAVGAISSVTSVSGFNILLEFAPADQRPTYLAVGVLVQAPLAFAAPIVGGFIADSAGYHSMFWVAAVLSLAATILLVATVQEPRRTPVTVAP